MTRFDDILGANKKLAQKKILRLVLEEDDDIISSIKQGMLENKVKEATVEDVTGILKEGKITNMENGKYNEYEIRETEIIRASGIFKFGGGDLWGSMNVFTGGRKPISGKLVKGKAMENLEIKLSVK
jgi:predicted DNA-binding protein with PD1-like motif